MKDQNQENETYDTWLSKHGGYANGMTLRDHYAGLAMQGLIARESTGAFNFETYPNDPWRVALWAYDVANQMLKARDAK